MKNKLSYILESILSTYIPNAIVNGLCYYFLNKNGTKDVIGFAINGIITAFILALICAPCTRPAVDKKIEKGIFEKGMYTKKNNIFARFMPKKTLGQLLYIAIIVTLVFSVVSTVLPIVCGYMNKPIEVWPGTIMHAFQTGFMGMLSAYLMVVARCSE